MFCYLAMLLLAIGAVLSQHFQNSITAGSWQVVVPNLGGGSVGKSLGMQTVSANVLPSGIILLVSGSSWRNRNLNETYPQVNDSQSNEGIFRQKDDPFRMDKMKDYYQLINNVGLYDPAENTFYRIPHPIPVPDPKWPEHFAPNDLFCTGHRHTADGNVLFVGGTQYYHPYRTGSRATYLFDWRKERNITWRNVDWRQMPNVSLDPWIFSGLMERGRWYATVVPLLDSRLAVIGGFAGFDPGYPPTYSFENNNFVEFFNPSIFKWRSDAQASWRKVDVKSKENGPFTNLINPYFRPTPGVNCTAQCVQDNQYDAFKLFEQAYLTAERRIFLTREGDWVSARTSDTAFMRATKETYHMHFSGSQDQPEITFSLGPARAENISSYGTTYFDPNSGRIALIGGQPTSPGTLLYEEGTYAGYQRFAGGRGSRKLEEFHASTYEASGGHWTLEPNFLGEHPQDDRTMHYALLLPTSQVLIINGGNYDFYGSVKYPLLLTPQFNNNTGAFSGYVKTRMHEALEARLYHNVAVLLPDGRVWTSGGDTARANINYSPLAVKGTSHYNSSSGAQPLPDVSIIDLDLEMFTDGRLAKSAKGSHTVPTETWVAEIFSPPYMFIDGQRRAVISSVSYPIPKDYQFESVISGKRYYLFHSNEKYLVHLTNLPSQCVPGVNATLVLIKLGSATHGWDGGQRLIKIQLKAMPATTAIIQATMPDARIVLMVPAFYMMFYVDCMGKPSIAQMIRFDDEAVRP